MTSKSFLNETGEKVKGDLCDLDMNKCTNLINLNLLKTGQKKM